MTVHQGMTTCQGSEAFDLLAFEGFPLEAITAAIDDLVRSGLSLLQGDKGPLLTSDEVDRLRQRLRARDS